MTSQGAKRKVVTVGDYRFTGRLLGKGNFARVEEAVHTLLNVKVAVKIIDIREIKEKYVVKNLHREARIMSTLKHPCIVALFQTMQVADNLYYLVSELVSGGDLCSFIIGQRYGKLEERTARIYARQFVSALSHMHSFGIVHRDLKMENVMLNSTQTQIKIVDFGLSNVWSSDNPLRTHCGSPEYAAPELFVAGKEYGPEVDLWSLGIIFYGMVVGQLPFVSGRKNQLSSQERRKRLVAQINKGLGTAQRQAISALSLEFRAMMNKLLMADPAKRITVKELIVHPWITERGRKIVQAHPIKKLDGQWQTKFTRQIGDVFQMEPKAVLGEIFKNPYGRLGGMYNIMNYKTQIETFNADNIALPNIRTDSTNKKYEQIVVEHKPLAKPKSAPTKSSRTLYNQCVVLLNKISKQQIEDRAKSAATSRIVTRNVAKITRTKTEASDVISKPNAPEKPHSAVQPKKVSQSRMENLAASIPVRKVTSSRLHSVTRTSAGSTASSKARRPQTTSSKSARAAPKPLKRTSVSTATGSNNSKTVTRKPSSSPPSTAPRRQVCLKQMGMGDGTDHLRIRNSAEVIFQKQKTGVATINAARDPLSNDPIARSIAGYLVKNVPDKMLSLQMIRK